MEIKDLLINYVQKKFLKNAPIIQTGASFEVPEYSIDLQGDIKYLNDLLETVCWIMTKDGLFYARYDSLLCNKSEQRLFKIDTNTLSIPQKHHYILMAFVIEGTLRLNILGNTVEFFKGEVCLIDKDTIHHAYINPGDTIVIYMGISDSFFSESRNYERQNLNKNIHGFLRNLIIKQKNRNRFIRFTPKESTINEASNLLSHFFEELWNSRSGSIHLIEGYMERLLSLLPTEYNFFLSNNKKIHKKKLLFDEVSNYLEKNCNQVSIENLCRKFNYNKDYFNRLIKKYSGLTYSKYLQNIRLEKAVVLLKTTKLSMKEIANTVGYNNIGYYYKIFYEKYNRKPGEYRDVF